MYVKKYFAIILTLALVAIIALSGCEKKQEQSAPQPAAQPAVTPPPPAPAPAPAPAKPAKK